jgi:hypothetical protein
MSVWHGRLGTVKPQVQFHIKNGQGKVTHNTSARLADWKAQWMAIKLNPFILDELSTKQTLILVLTARTEQSAPSTAHAVGICY